MATATVTKGEETRIDTRYFLSSITDVERFAYAVRKHWAIENQLHWCLDVIFDEDSSRARKDMSPLNLNVLRKVALALCKNADFGRRVSIQKKRFIVALNPKNSLPSCLLTFKCCCPGKTVKLMELLNKTESTRSGNRSSKYKGQYSPQITFLSA